MRKKLQEAKDALAKSLVPKTEDQKADDYMENAEKHEACYKHFAYLRDDDKSEEYINDHPELLNEHATGWMLLHCLELEMAGDSKEMHKVARQNEMLEYITRSCREVKIVDDPRAATMPFFRSMRHPDPRAREGFTADMQGVIDKITERAKVKKLEQAAAEPEEVRFLHFAAHLYLTFSSVLAESWGTFGAGGDHGREDHPGDARWTG